MKQGKFFVLEGMDGSGKATQTKLLTEALKNKGYDVVKIDFPQYGKGSASLLETYLRGDYGLSEEVGPYRASIFYACDRYDLSFKMKKWLEEGKIIIADRYLASNIGHQGGKIISNKEEWNKYVDWLHNLEFNIFEIPRPDYTLILKISPELSMQHSNKIKDEEKKQKRLAYLGDDTKQDIHEADKNHLANTLKSYTAISERYPDFYKIVDCQNGEDFLSIDIIHQKIIKLIEEKI